MVISLVAGRRTGPRGPLQFDIPALECLLFTKISHRANIKSPATATLKPSELSELSGLDSLGPGTFCPTQMLFQAKVVLL